MTNAHHIPSKEPRQKLGGNSFGLDLKSYQHQQIASKLHIYQCVKIVKTTTINFLAQGGINVNIRAESSKTYLAKVRTLLSYLLIVEVSLRVLYTNRNARRKSVKILLKSAPWLSLITPHFEVFRL